MSLRSIFLLGLRPAAGKSPAYRSQKDGKPPFRVKRSADKT